MDQCSHKILFTLLMWICATSWRCALTYTNQGSEGEEGDGREILFLFGLVQFNRSCWTSAKNTCLNRGNTPLPSLTEDSLCAHSVFIQVNSHKIYKAGTMMIHIFQVKKLRPGE